MPFFIFFILLLFSFPSHAEPVPGDSCAAYPNGAVMHSGGPELSGKVYVLTCAAGIWAGAAINPDPCAESSPLLGIRCSDGTIYAGLSPDGNGAMYAMPNDGPLGGNAISPVGGYSWNDGSSNWVDTAMVNCTSVNSMAASCNTGRTNTTLLAAIAGASPAPYKAAQYCENLTANGYSDWYLPAQNELKLLYALYQAGKGGFVADYYWSSSEYNDGNAWEQNFSSGDQEVGNRKSWGFRVRCVRR